MTTSLPACYCYWC